MIVEIKVQTEDRLTSDSVLLTREMIIELIDHNPTKLKRIIKNLGNSVNFQRNKSKPKGLSQLLIAVSQLNSSL